MDSSVLCVKPQSEIGVNAVVYALKRSLTCVVDDKQVVDAKHCIKRNYVKKCMPRTTTDHSNNR